MTEKESLTLRVFGNHILILLNWFSKCDNAAELG